MTAEVINGHEVAAQFRAELASRIAVLRRAGVTPGLAVVLVGDNAASVSYVRGKTRAAAELEILSESVRPDPDISQADLLNLVNQLNADDRFHGIIVQLPLPDGIDERAITAAVDPRKDVDGLHPINLGRLLRGDGRLLPCTPAGVRELLVRSGHGPDGRHVVICGRSNLVGKPLAAILLQKQTGANATITVCHTGTPDLGAVTRLGDILVVATGRANMITADMVRPGAVVVDVGVNRVSDASRKSGYRLVGDVDFESVSRVARAITPVPGGVGPMTVTMLLVNTVLAAEASSLRYT
jgi:methylenetetrahydrofolate dehydrogenase (NADP+)/methenyltetrahydrofolate cyclohydrolase